MLVITGLAAAVRVPFYGPQTPLDVTRLRPGRRGTEPAVASAASLVGLALVVRDRAKRVCLRPAAARASLKVLWPAVDVFVTAECLARGAAGAFLVPLLDSGRGAWYALPMC